MKKSNFFILCIALAGLNFSAVAQVENPVMLNTADENAFVIKDARIDLLIQQQKYINTLALRNVTGYRVQVLSTSNRAAANQAKAKLMQLFPQYKTYLDYQSPYFRVRIGDFLQRDSAGTLREQLVPYFPNGVFTVKDQIKIDPEVLLQQVKTQHETED